MSFLVNDNNQVRVSTITPNEIQGIYGWWDFADYNGLPDGTNMLSWSDKSGNGFDFNLRSGVIGSKKQTALNGNAVLSGSSVYDAIIPLSGSASFTTFIVFKNIGNTILGSSGDATGWGITNNGAALAIYQGSANVSITPDSNYHQFSWVTNNTPAQRIIRMDRVSKTPVANGIGNLTFLCLNHRGITQSNGTNEFAEMIIYNRTLSLDEITKVEKYLKFKWSL